MDVRSEEKPSRDTRKVEDFEIVKIIGNGYCKVFEARLIEDDSTVALKIGRFVGTGYSDKKRERKEYLQAIHEKMNLRHPNIVCYFDLFQTDDEDQVYLVGEKAGSVTLRRLIKHFKSKSLYIPEKTIWKYFLPVCEAVSYLHTFGNPLGGLRPDKIFIDEDGRVKLDPIDMKRADGFRNHIDMRDSCYSLSPEKFLEREVSSSYRESIDTWSLGLILYELATLELPFWNESINLFSLCKNVEKCEIPQIPELYSSELQALCIQCLAKNPSERPNSMAIFEQATKMHLLFSS